MNKNFLAVLGVVALVTTLGAGCGGPTTGGGGGKAVSGMEDVCNYFPKELVEEAIGRPIVKTEDSMVYDACDYYTEYDEGYYGGRGAGGPNVIAVLEEKNLDDAWRAEMEGKSYTVEQGASISIENYVVKRKTGEPWQVNLIVGGGKILRFQTNHSAVTGEDLVKIAAKFADKIK